MLAYMSPFYGTHAMILLEKNKEVIECIQV